MRAPILGILLLAFLGPAGGIQAQSPDSLPQFAKGRLDWSPYDKLAPKRFNQKDYAVYMVRVNGLHEIFETDPQQQWVDDFHFFDVNSDLMPDAIYSGESKYFKGDRSMVMIGDTSLKYPVTFDQPGYIHALAPADSGMALTVVEEASGTGFRVNVGRFFYDFSADSARRIWGLQYISTTQVPDFREGARPFVLKRPTYLRTHPQVVNEPAIDYDQDERPDGVGNIAGELKPGLLMFRLARAEGEGREWSFVILLEAPQGEHLFLPPTLAEGIQGYAGWLPSEAIAE